MSIMMSFAARVFYIIILVRYLKCISAGYNELFG